MRDITGGLKGNGSVSIELQKGRIETVCIEIDGVPYFLPLFISSNDNIL
jgi:hypothetical protein